MKGKKVFALLLVAAMTCTTFLGGCGSSDSNTDSGKSDATSSQETGKEDDSSDEAVELTISWWGNDARAEYTQKLLDMYSEENPNVTFVATPTSWDGYWDKLATQAAGGTAPDIIQMDYSMISTYSNNGSLADLQKYVDDGTIDTSTIDANLVNSGKIDGKLTGIAISQSTVTMGYNPDVLKEAGVENPTKDWTWDDYKDMCTTVYEKTGKVGMGNSILGPNLWPFHVWLRENNVALYNDDGTALGYEDDSIAAEWFQFWKDLVDTGAAINPDQWEVEKSKSQEAQLMATGEAAFAVDSNTIGSMVEATNDHIGLVTLPMKEGGNDKANWMKPGMFLSVSSTASEEKQKEAAKFINWFTNSEEAGAVIGTDRGIPASSTVRDALKSGKIGSLSDVQKAMFEYADEAASISGECPAPDPEGTSEINEIYINCYNEVLYGQGSAEDVAAEFREKVNAVLAKNKK